MVKNLYFELSFPLSLSHTSLDKSNLDTLTLSLLPVWPDWAIFESSWQQICLQKSPKKIVDFWAIYERDQTAVDIF